MGTTGAGSQTDGAAPDLPARVAGRYRVEAHLARGGMGEVLRVVDESSGKRMALKRLLPAMRSNRRVVRLFEREYHTLAGLQHPRIIEVYDCGVEDDSPYYTMELLGGQDMRELSPMPYREACRHLRDVASSLALLHARRLVHRDVGPSNVRRTSDGRCKLIDFGSLANFGVSDDIVGTPPCIPPEALYKMSLDGRADLFALGALAYFMLTGRHAYAAKQIDKLPEIWKRRPAAPSVFADVPAALDKLVLDLLNENPLARPSSAAAVIDRLNAIAGLEPEEELSAAQSYLSSSPLVGRDHELRRLRSHLEDAARGHGSSVWIESTAGMGKTRILDELSLEARLGGATVLRVDAEMHPGPYGAIRSLAEKLLDIAPERAVAAAKPRADWLASVVPGVARHAASTIAATSSFPPRLRRSVPPADAEQAGGQGRLRLQAAFHDWLLAAGAGHPLVVAVDNVHAVDEFSGAVLAALAHSAKERTLFLLFTRRSEASAGAGTAVRGIYEASSSLKLRGLGRDETTTLVEALFGKVPNTARLANWLYELTGGNPLKCMELARHLVARSVVRYMQGTWVVPAELHEGLPAGIEEPLTTRIAELDVRARTLAESLSIFGGPIRLELGVAVAESEGQPEVFAALDDLVREGVLIAAEDKYRFEHQALREVLRGGLEPERRRSLHRRAGEALLADAGEDLYRIQEAAFHLLHGGDRERGADLLAKTAVALAADVDNLGLAAPALEAAVAVYREQGRHDDELMPLLAHLTAAGYYVDRKLAVRYGEEAARFLQRASGMALATRLRPFLGRHLSLGIGVAFAFVRHALKPRARRLPSFRDHLVMLFGCAASLGGIGVLTQDVAAAQRAMLLLEPLSILGQRLAPTAVYQLVRGFWLMTQDCPAESRAHWQRLLIRLQDPAQVIGLPERERHIFMAGAMYVLGALETFRDGQGALEYAERLQALDDKLYDLVADQLRMLYHAQRGELERVKEYRERIDRHAIQRGFAWQVEIWAPSTLSGIYRRTEDVLALKRVVEELDDLASEVPSLERYATTARAAYMTVRGDAQAGVRLYESVVENEAPRAHIGGTAIMGGFARALNALGQHERAKARCLETMRHVTPADRQFVALNIDLQIELALADAGLGDLDAAASRLAALIEARGPAQNPLTLGLLHDASARVALMAGDTAAFASHLQQVARWFLPTANPALVAKHATLLEQGTKVRDRSDGFTHAFDTAIVGELTVVHATRAILDQCEGPQGRAQRILELLVQETNALGGFLYVTTKDGVLRLVAPLHGEGPPSAVEADLRRTIDSLADDEVEETALVASDDCRRSQAARDPAYRQIVLSIPVDGALAVVGGAVLQGGPKRYLTPEPHLLRAIARILYDAGDAVTVHVELRAIETSTS